MPSLARAVLAAFLGGVVLASCGGAASPGSARTGSPADQLAAATKEVDKAIDAMQAGDAAKAKKEFLEFDEEWDKFEDGIKAKSADSYRKIEDAMDDVEASLVKAATVEKDKALAALKKLRQTIDAELPKVK